MSIALDGTNGITFNNSSTQAQSAGLGTSAAAQTWQNVTGSRAVSTTYTNSTGYPIMVCISGSPPSGNAGRFSINGSVVAFDSGSAGVGTNWSFIIPNGATYGITFAAGSSWSIAAWVELR